MKILRLMSAVLAAALGVLASTAQAEIKTGWVEYSHGGAKLKGYLAYDDSITGKRPGILMVHRRDGMTPLTLKNTEMYAKMGYVAFAPDIFGYGQGILPKDIPEMVQQMGIYVKDRELMRARTQAKNIKGTKVLILHGAEDVPAPLSEVDILIKDFRASKTDFQYELYSGAGDGFSTPKDKAEERANVQSIASTERFLKEVFAR